MTEDQFKALPGDSMFVVLYVNGKQCRTYWFKLPALTAPDYYNTCRSCSFFKQRERKNLSADIRCHVMEEYDSMLSVELELGIYSKLPMSYHESLWAFYTEIGYDYQQQRYTKSATDFQG